MEIKELTREEMGGLIAGIHALGKDRLRDLVLQIWQMSEGYEQVEIDNRRLVRELDVLINGENAAQQASLCDIVAQVKSEGLKAAPAMKAVVWRHDDGPFAGAALTRAKSVADNWVSKGWKVTPLYELVEPGGEHG